MTSKIYNYISSKCQQLICIVLFWMVILTEIIAAPTEHKTLVYTHPDPPVFTLLDKDGETYDPMLHKVSVILQEAGLEWQDSPVPIHRMYNYLYTRPEYFSILVKTPYIIKCCITSKNPVFRLELGLYRKSETPPIQKIQSIIGKTIITIENYSYGVLKPFLADENNKIIQHPATTHQSAYAMLKAGRANYLLDYRGPVRQALDEKQNHGIQYDVLETLELYFIFNKKYPDVEDLVMKLEKISHNLEDQF